MKMVTKDLVLTMQEGVITKGFGTHYGRSDNFHILQFAHHNDDIKHVKFCIFYL